jgi:precorrin-2/cobalt-factor-2 C20-methyltransferase
MGGTLIGVGVGPGDPELLTLKALRALRDADRVFVPVTDTGETGRAERVIAGHADEAKVERLMFAMSDSDARAGNWDRAGEAIAAVVRDGGTAAFATIGDPNIYSTFTYVAQTVLALARDTVIETIPGITAMQDLAARSGTVLAEGTERLALFPFTAGEDRLREALEVFDTVVCYKGGRRLPVVLGAVRDAGRIEDAIYGARLGVDGEEVRPATDLGPDETGPYMSTVIVPARRDDERGGRI